jgi:acyl-CoA synthetase (NDP forming)
MATPQTAIFSGSQFDQRGKKFAIALNELCFPTGPAAKTKTAQSCYYGVRRSEIGEVKVYRRDRASVRQLYKSTFSWQKENSLLMLLLLGETGDS